MYDAPQEEHDVNLWRVLQALTNAGLKLNMNKCHFNQSSLNYLGYMILKDGLHPDKEGVAAVINAPAPHDTFSLQSFLGLASCV